jgi:parallel beta-helix repeat protein
VQITNQVRALSNELNQAISLAEPRIPITASTAPGNNLSLFIITQAGSYYLTGSVATTINGITVNTNDVTVDLRGFTLSGEGGVGNLGISINQHNRVTVRHGTVKNFGQGAFITAPATNTLIEDVFAEGCVSGGFLLHGNDGIVRRCRASGNQVGFNLVNGVRNVVEDCEAMDNTQTGFLIGGTNNLIIRNLAGGNPDVDYSISLSNHVGTIVMPALTTGTVSSGGPGSGTTDPFANLRY